MATVHILKREVILSAIRSHHQTIQDLDTQYNKFIDNVLQQKKRIIIRIQQQFYQQIKHVYNFNQPPTFDYTSLFSLLFTDQKLNAKHDIHQNIKIDNTSYLKNEYNLDMHKISVLGSHNSNTSFISTQDQHENNIAPAINMPQLIPEPEPESTVADDNCQEADNNLNNIVLTNQDDITINPLDTNITDNQSQQATKKFKCLQCNYSTNNKAHFIRHGLVHSQQRNYACNNCNKRFKDKCGLTRHMRIHNKPKIKKKWKCSYCNYETKNKGHLTDHIRIHTKERPFACSYCDKRFKQKGYLKSHLRIHTQEKQFECSYCGKQFRCKGNLDRHIRVHTNERPYKCKYDNCDSAFKTSSDLKNHTRIHTGERPYGCSYCKKKFKTNSDLKKHTRIHTGEKPFKCEKCNKRFTQSSSCRKHIKTCK